MNSKLTGIAAASASVAKQIVENNEDALIL
jgi:hypothetical protein